MVLLNLPNLVPEQEDRQFFFVYKGNTEMVQSLFSRKPFLEAFSFLIGSGALQFFISQQGVLVSPNYSIIVSTTNSLFEAIKISDSNPELVVEFERTPFGDFFGIHHPFETKSQAESFAQATGLPLDVVRQSNEYNHPHSKTRKENQSTS